MWNIRTLSGMWMELVDTVIIMKIIACLQKTKWENRKNRKWITGKEMHKYWVEIIFTKIEKECCRH